MGDMSHVIVPKSDQINADDLLSGSMTITITDVKVSSGQEQPVSMFFAGSTKAFRPCKSMARVLVSAWGADSAKYIGRSLTLYCDPKVKWGGMEVGGIRISHMSNIDSAITMALTVTRANKKPFTVRPIESAPPASVPAGTPAVTQGAQGGADAVYITPEQAMALEAQCQELGITEAFKAAAQVERFSLVLAEDLAAGQKWISKRAKSAQGAAS